MSAILSDCQRYRYTLERWPNGMTLGRVVFIGVNPSTADATLDDATVRKWLGFASRWGYGRMTVANLFAWRSTDVRELAKADDPVGPDNDFYLQHTLKTADLVVPCWGSRDKLPDRLRHRIDTVRGFIRDCGRPVSVLGLTASGDPKHPLMLGYSTPLTEWSTP